MMMAEKKGEKGNLFFNHFLEKIHGRQVDVVSVDYEHIVETRAPLESGWGERTWQGMMVTMMVTMMVMVMVGSQDSGEERKNTREEGRRRGVGELGRVKGSYNGGKEE